MKIKKNSAYAALILAAVSAASADQTRNATATNVNLGTAWASGTAPLTGDVALWDATSALTNVIGANQTWGGLNTSAASGAVGITGAFTLTLDHSTDANTVFNAGANDFSWGTAGAAGAFNINGAAGSTSSTATGATFAGSGLVTLSSTGTKNWSTNGTTNSVTNVTFTGTLALRGATIPAAGVLPTNWLALGGGGGAASAVGTTSQTGSFALDTGDATSCGALILTHGWSGQFLKLNSLRGTGSVRADWGVSAGTQTRGIELDQSGDTKLSGSILVHNGSSQRRNVSLVKKGLGTLTLTGGLGSSQTAGSSPASLNFDVQAGAIQLGDGTTNPIYVNVANWDSLSTFNIGSAGTLRFVASSAFTWSRAITGGSGKIEITSDGDPGEGDVTFTANNSAFAGNVDVLAGSLRIGPNLGTGTLTVKGGSFISTGLPATNGVSQVGALILEGDTQSNFRLGAINDRIDVTGSLTPPASGTHTINLSGTTTAGGTLKLIDFTGTALTDDAFARFALGSTPSGAATYQLVNNPTDASLDLLVTLEDQLWKGRTDGNWNDTITNWALASTPGTPMPFNPDHPSVFDDDAAIFAVVVDDAGVSPTSTTFKNAITPYTLTGGAITGTGPMVKGGAAMVTLALPLSYSGGTTVNLGTLVLSGATNMSSGGTTVNGGTLNIGDGAATGDIGFGTATVGAAGTLRFNRDNSAMLDYKTTAKMRNVSGAGAIIIDGGVTFFNYTGTGTGFAEAGSWAGFSGNLTIKGGSEFLTIRNGATAMGTGTVILGEATTSGSLASIEGNWTWTNPITLTGPANKIISRSVGPPRSTKLQGVISGSGGLTFEDPAAGMTDPNRGFVLTATNLLDGTLTIATGVPLRVGGVPGNTDISQLGPDAFGTLGTATVVNDGTLTFSRNDAHAVANAISGGGNVRVGIPAAAGLGSTATQVLTYTGTATYLGTTTVNNGTLIVGTGGSIAGAGVTVESTATLGGTGSVAAPLTAAGVIAPGTGIGTLPVTGNTALTGTLAIEVDGPNTDLLMVTGDLTLTGSTLTVTPSGAGFTGTSYVIAECTGTLTGLPAAPVGYAVSAVGKQVILKKGGYDSWKIDNAGGQAANLDFDNDGVSNGVEYFMGETGSTFTANPSIVNGKVTWKHDPTAVATFMVQLSDNLNTWTDVVPPHASIDETVAGQVTFTLPTGAAVKFCRLVVTP
jgi:autotransporter-associated beta strand protein